MRGLSLRARVLAGMAVVVVALVAVAAFITATTRAYLIDQVDDRLSVAAQHERDKEFDRGPPPGGEPGRLSDLYEGVIGDDGELFTFFAPNLSGADAIPDIDADEAAALAASGTAATVDAVGDTDVRYRVRVREGDGGLYVTGLPLTDVDDTISRLITVELIATAVIVAVLAAVAWWVVRLGIRPIKQMTRTATEIAAGDLSHGCRRWRPPRRPGNSGGRSTTCWSRWRRRSPSAPNRRSGSVSSSPTRPTSCARR